jgi:hypothetical protein
VLNISIEYQENSVLVSSKDDTIIFQINSNIPVNKERQDFAVWLFLPIAMKKNEKLHIKGKGTEITIQNAKKMSQIWASWMPSHFRDIDITFDEIVLAEISTKYVENEICFYSGGIDSTYSIASKIQNGKRPLLTVHGMEYAFDDNEKFKSFIEKTQPFADIYAKERIFVKTNAYAVYNKYKVNTKQNHITHIFVLGATGFLYTGYTKTLLIAADYRIDQQFMVFPWGSNSATNYLFDDGITSLVTENDTITRSEKIPFLTKSKQILNSLTFCVDKKSRPYNCGLCSKCIRTKIMFFAATGKVPDIFINKDISENLFDTFNINSKSEQAFITDLYYCAKNNNRLKELPKLEYIMKKMAKPKKRLFSKWFKK